MATGFKELALVPALRKQGLSVLKARAVIDAVFDSIKDVLGRHEDIELPIGTFIVERNPEQRRAWKFGQVTVLYAHRYRVDFLPSNELNLAAAAPPLLPDPKRKRRKKKLTGSELTISAQLIVEFIRQNVPSGDWNQFFEYLSAPVGPSIAAAFKNAKPTPDERRPIGEAAQVIEECAPEEMPEDSRRRLDACLVWFARWTQRVMPNAIWQQLCYRQ
jgi:nucleoid DNA-binding protein